MGVGGHIHIVRDASEATTTSEPSNETLQKAQGGGREAQEEVFAYLYPLVRKHLYFVLGTRLQQGLDEATQESMLQIFRGLPKFRGDAKLATWALRIAIRQAHRYASHSRKRESVPLEDWTEVGFLSPPSVTATQLVKLLHVIKPKKREAFVLMELFDMTAHEAGRALGVSANTAASRSRHAKIELRDALGEAPA